MRYFMGNQLKGNLRYQTLKIFLRMITALLAFEPILANIIAIGMAIGILILLNHPALFPNLRKYHLYFFYTMYILIMIQTIKSSRKSAFIPLLALAPAALVYLILSLSPHAKIIDIEI
jgi:hypothetical protein